MSDFNLEFSGAAEFLDLFGIDREKRGAADFCELVDKGVLLRRFPELKYGTYDAAVFARSVQHVSPLVYWSNMRRALAPIVECDRGALEALVGVPLPEGEITAYTVADAVTRALVRAEAYRERTPEEKRAAFAAASLLAAAIRKRKEKK